MQSKFKKKKIVWQNKKSLCIVLCSKGYPEDYKKNVEIKNLNNIKKNNNIFIFHAGTKINEDTIFATGGRVLNFVSISDDFKDSRNQVIEKIKKLNWKNGFFRKDIGHKIIKA